MSRTNRNVTPRMTKAAGARDAHGSILDPSKGALYVHMHRESGLAHRHYVLKPWQVRVLRFLLSRVMLLLYVVAILTWGWMASQAARVPLLQQRISDLTRDAERLDTLTAALTEAQSRYEQVQKMLGTSGTVRTGGDATPRPAPPAVRRDSAARDSIARDSAKRDTSKTIKRDSVRRDTTARDTLRSGSMSMERE